MDGPEECFSRGGMLVQFEKILPDTPKVALNPFLVPF